MARSKNSQSKHNGEVGRLASQLQNRGYSVDADIKGFDQPKTIGGYRPDIIAKKGFERKIIEVETPDSLNSARDIKQQQAFQRAAKRSQKTTFTKKVAK